MAASTTEEIRMGSPLQELAAMQRRSAEIAQQISEAEEAYGIRLLREQKAEIDAAFSARLGEVAPTLPYGEDRFLKAIKRKGESYREGSLKIIRSSRTTRAVLTEEFAAAFPDLLKSVCKVELTKADALIGKKTMERYVEKKTTYSYELVDLKEDII
jgi:hypothetical protein